MLCPPFLVCLNKHLLLLVVIPRPLPNKNN
jgi:hypothetical protein